MANISKNRTAFIRKELAKNKNAASRDIINAWDSSEEYDAVMLPRHVHQMRHNIKCNKKKVKKSFGSVSFNEMPSSSVSPRAKFEGKKSKSSSPMKDSLIKMESTIEELIQKASELRQSKTLKENLINCRRLIGSYIIQGDE